jgi:hypothetical protein
MASAGKRGLLKRLTGALFEGAAGATPASEPSATATPPAPARGNRRDLAHAAFQGRIAELLEQGQAAVAGKLQFVDLDAIKAELGERWQIIADKVREVTQRTIERRLAPGDAYVAYDDDSYLLLFANLTEAQARIKATAIAMEIRQRMTGDFNLVDRYWVRTFVADLADARADGAPELAALDRRLGATRELAHGRNSAAADAPLWDRPPRVVPPSARATPEQTAAAQARFEARVGEVARQLGQGSTGKLQLLQLDRLRAELGERWAEIVDRVRAIAEQVLARRLAPVDVFAPIDEGCYLILFAALAEDEAQLQVAAIAREIRDRLLGEVGPSPAVAVAAFVAPLAEVARLGARAPTIVEIDRALSEREDVAPPPDTASQAELRPRLGEVGVCYRPMLYTKTGMVSVFGAQAMRLEPDGAIERGLAAYPANDPPVSFEIDRAVLQRALKDARRLVRRSERALVTVPVRLQSLIDHSSGQLVDLCRSQRPAVRRLIVIEIVNLLPDAPTARLGEAIAPIQPFCRAAIISVPPQFTDFERAARLGVASVGVELASLDPRGAARDQLVARLAGFAAGAHMNGMTAHLHGIADHAVLEAARAAGFDYLNGPAVVAEAVRPVAMHAYTAPSDR